MRVDFNFGTEANSIEHLPSDIAAILLGRNISRKTFGDAFHWIYIVTRAKPGKKEPKMTWRWAKERKRHIVVESDVTLPDGISLRDSIIRLLESCKDIARRLNAFIEENVSFDKPAFLREVEKTIAEVPSDAELKTFLKNMDTEHVRRMGEVMFGFEAYRALVKKDPRTTSLAWLRLYVATKDASGWSSKHQKEISLVGHLIACALSRKISTPGYAEIYINLGSEEVDVRYRRRGLEEWSENAYALLPESAFKLKDMSDFRKGVLEACRIALLKMAANEGLDSDTIKKCLDAIDVAGLSTVFELGRVEHNNLEARIEYDFLNRRDDRAILQPLFRLCVKNTDNGKNKVFDLGPGDVWKMERIFSKIVVKPNSKTIEVVATPASGTKTKTVDIASLI
ncbi:MAG: hypothetical protein ABI644_13470 [Arenimonas sp.]